MQQEERLSRLILQFANFQASPKAVCCELDCSLSVCNIANEAKQTNVRQNCDLELTVNQEVNTGQSAGEHCQADSCPPSWHTAYVMEHSNAEDSITGIVPHWQHEAICDCNICSDRGCCGELIGQWRVQTLRSNLQSINTAFNLFPGDATQQQNELDLELQRTWVGAFHDKSQ